MEFFGPVIPVSVMYPVPSMTCSSAVGTCVWVLGDVGIGLMTIFNMLALYPLAGEALTALREYEAKKKLK